MFALSRHHPPTVSAKRCPMTGSSDDPVNTDISVGNKRRGVLDTPHMRSMTAAPNCIVRVARNGVRL